MNGTHVFVLRILQHLQALKSKGQNAAPSTAQGGTVPLPSITAASGDSNVPVIPVDIVDAPSQRLYATAVYIGLILWRCHDYWRLLSDESDSLPLFLKWV
jgi:nucleoporin POM152